MSLHATTAEIDSVEALLALIEARRPLAGVFVQSLDMRTMDLRHVDVTGAVFLGCTMTDAQTDSLRDRGALLFPKLPHSPVNPYRSGLYTASELYDTISYADSYDARVYAWTRTTTAPPSLEHTLTCALHDTSISDALDEATANTDPRRSVGIMGGHAAARGSSEFAQTARLSRSLARAGHLVFTGGGPGAMEAGNLGALLADSPDAQMDDALARLATVPSFRPAIDPWAQVALDVLAAVAKPHPNVAIPTWFYGHEPPNVFGTFIAKYFSNALREDTLLARCKGGIIYQAGAAGTVQELFQAVTSSYYAADPAQTTPIVLVGTDFWTTTLPAWPLLQALAKGRAMENAIFIARDTEEAVDLLATGIRG